MFWVGDLLSAVVRVVDQEVLNKGALGDSYRERHLLTMLGTIREELLVIKTTEYLMYRLLDGRIHVLSINTVLYYQLIKNPQAST